MGAMWAACYLIPYKAATALGPAEAVVRPMLASAAVLNSFFTWARRPRKAHGVDRTSLGVAVLLGALSALGNEAIAHALATIGPGTASVLLRTQVIFVALGGWWLLRERVSLRFGAGALLALTGFALLQRRLGASDGMVTGMLWALLAAVTFAGMQVIIRHSAQRIQLMLVNSLRLWVAVGLLALVPGRLALAAGVDLRIWLLAAVAAFFGPVLSRICLMHSLRHITAAMCTLVTFLAPVFAFLLGGLFLGTWPGLGELLCGLVILTGVALPLIENSSPGPAEPEP